MQCIVRASLVFSYPMLAHSLGAHWRMWMAHLGVYGTKHVCLIACISIIQNNGGLTWYHAAYAPQMVPGLGKLWCTESTVHDWLVTHSRSTLMCSFGHPFPEQ